MGSEGFGALIPWRWEKVQILRDESTREKRESHHAVKARPWHFRRRLAAILRRPSAMYRENVQQMQLKESIELDRFVKSPSLGREFPGAGGKR